MKILTFVIIFIFSFILSGCPRYLEIELYNYTDSELKISVDSMHENIKVGESFKLSNYRDHAIKSQGKNAIPLTIKRKEKEYSYVIPFELVQGVTKIIKGAPLDIVTLAIKSNMKIYVYGVSPENQPIGFPLTDIEVLKEKRGR